MPGRLGQGQCRDRARRHPRALLDAIGWIRDTPNDGQLAGMRARFSGVPDDLLILILDSLKPAFKRDGTITAASVDKAGRLPARHRRDRRPANPPGRPSATNDYLPK